MKEDPFFDEFDIYVYGYSSPFRGVSYKVDELVEDMRRDLDDAGVFQSHKKVFFLCHSMGGLIVRAFLTRYQSRASKVPVIYFFSTPTTGAQIAAIGSLLSKNPQLKAMLPIGSNEYLAAVQKDWLAARFSIASYCAYETQDTDRIRIVGQESATNLCNRPLDPINANHFDVVKPRDQRDTPYAAFRAALKEWQQEATQKPVPVPASPPLPRDSQVNAPPATEFP